MKRRSFLKLLGAAPAAAALPAVKFPVLTPALTPFGLASLKAEGTSVAFDYADADFKPKDLF